MIETQKTKWKHNKTGNIYTFLHTQAIEWTNGREDIDYSEVYRGE